LSGFNAIKAFKGKKYNFEATWPSFFHARVLVHEVPDRGAQAAARGAARCVSQLFDRDAQADARGIAQVLNRGAQAVAHGATR
jgi:hypothetical protein